MSHSVRIEPEKQMHTAGGTPIRYPKATRADLTAPTSQFRVLGVILERNCAEIYVIGDFPCISAAERAAMQRAGVGSPVYVYNDKADLVVRYGSWH